MGITKFEPEIDKKWRAFKRSFRYSPDGKGVFQWEALKGTMKRFFFYGIISAVMGLCIGIVIAFFGRGLLFLNAWRQDHLLFLVPFLGVSGVIIMAVYLKYGGPAKQGMGLIFSVGLGEEKTIPLRMVPLTIFSTWMTHLFGGSAGREGVAVQIGATISMLFARLQTKEEGKHIIIISGMAAGFAGLFGTPMAATFFALEVLVVGSVYYSALAPALIASYCASFMARSLGLVGMSMPISGIPVMDAKFLVISIIAGLIFGVVGFTFSWLLNHFRLFFALLIDDPRLRIFIVGSLLAVAFIFFGDGRYCGLSEELFTASFSNGDIHTWDWLCKLILTVLTLSCGFQGGELTPLFVIGATLGAVLAGPLGLPVALVAAMGSIAVFGAATKTVFAPIFIGAEVFGAEGLAFYTMASMVAFLISGHYGIYTRQKYISSSGQLSDSDKN